MLVINRLLHLNLSELPVEDHTFFPRSIVKFKNHHLNEFFMGRSKIYGGLQG